MNTRFCLFWEAPNLVKSLTLALLGDAALKMTHAASGRLIKISTGRCAISSRFDLMAPTCGWPEAAALRRDDLRSGPASSSAKLYEEAEVPALRDSGYAFCFRQRCCLRRQVRVQPGGSESVRERVGGRRSGRGCGSTSNGAPCHEILRLCVRVCAPSAFVDMIYWIIVPSSRGHTN